MHRQRHISAIFPAMCATSMSPTGRVKTAQKDRHKTTMCTKMITPLRYLNRSKTSNLTFIIHTERLRSTVQIRCMSCMVKEDVVDTRTDRDQIYSVAVRHSLLQWAAMASLTFQLRNSLLNMQDRGTYPECKKPQECQCKQRKGLWTTILLIG